MARAVIDLYWDDEKVRKLISADGFVKAFNRHMSQQLIGFIAHAKSQVRNQILSGKYPSNNIQRYIKGGSARALVQS